MAKPNWDLKGPMLQFQMNWKQMDKIKKAAEALYNQKYQRGYIRDSVLVGLEFARNYAMSITHIYTGVLKESHVISYDSHAMLGSLHINPETIAYAVKWNTPRATPRGYSQGVRILGKARTYQGRTLMVYMYANWEHMLGGTHAFYERTWRDKGKMIANRAMSVYLKTCDQGVRHGKFSIPIKDLFPTTNGTGFGGSFDK